MERKLEGKTISIFYEDGTQRVSRKDGTVVADSGGFIELKDGTIIPNIRIVRIEIKNEEVK